MSPYKGGTKLKSKTDNKLTSIIETFTFFIPVNRHTQSMSSPLLAGK